MAHIMFDLETFGTKPGSVLRSIGAVVFDPATGHTGATFYSNIDRASCEAVGLTVDPGTEAWWKKQAIEAQNALLQNCRPIADVVRDFHAWFRTNGGNEIWCQGANFDSVLWQSVADAVRQPVPWKFWNVRDTRTAYDCFGLNANAIGRAGTYHNALDDSLHQVRCVSAAYARGRVPAPSLEDML